MTCKRNLTWTFFALLLISLTTLPGWAEIKFSQTQIFDTGDRPSHIDAGDINGDGFTDLVIANMMSDSISIAYNNGKGKFENIAVIPYLNDKKHPTSVATGDLDGDGRIDIATSQIQDILNSSTPFQNVGIVLFFNKGDGAFDQVYVPFDGNPSMILIRDVDGDGKKDLIVGDNGELSIEAQLVGQFEPGITIYKNAGNRKFDMLKNMLTDGSVVYMNYADYNKDAYSDITSVSQGHISIDDMFQIVITEPAIYIYKGSASGLPADPSIRINLDQDPYTCCLTDMDKDGKEDLVVSLVGDMDLLQLTGKNAAVQIYHNNGNSFELSNSIPLPGIGYQVMTSDFNNDGNVDFAVTVEKVIPEASGTKYEPYLKFYENDGSGNFKEITGVDSKGESQPVFAVDRLPRYAVAGDFDNDGNMDIAVLCSIKDAAESGTAARGKVYIFHNDAVSAVPEWTLY